MDVRWRTDPHAVALRAYHRPVILLVRLLIAFAVGVAASWLVYAFAGDSFGNGYIIVVAVVGVVAFLIVGQTAWYQRFRRAAWGRRLRRMGDR